MLENQIQIREQNIQEITIDAMNLIQLNQVMIEKLSLKIKEMQPKVELYDRFLDANGEIDCAAVSDIIGLYYINPKGKKERMGRDYLIQVLEHDNIIFKGTNGYKLYSSHKDHGRTKTTEKYGYIRNSVLFNSKGIDYLVKKYKDERRIWRAIDGQLYCTGDAA